MPIIRTEGPPVKEVDKKRAFVKTVTEAAATLYGMPEHSIIVVFQENRPDNVSVGGQLIIDRPHEEPGAK